MWALFLQFLPFFALVALGWAGTRGGLVPLAGIPALNVFVLYFGLPAMLFKLGASGALLQPGLGGWHWCMRWPVWWWWAWQRAGPDGSAGLGWMPRWLLWPPPFPTPDFWACLC